MREREQKREKETVTLASRGNPWPVSSYFFVQLCLSTLEKEGRMMGLEILAGPMRRGRADSSRSLSPRSFFRLRLSAVDDN